MTIHHSKLDVPVDIAALQKDVKALMKLDWVDHFVKDNYVGAWSILPLWAVKGAEHPILMCTSNPGDTDFVPTPFVKDAQNIRLFIDSLPFETLSVRLMNLCAGSEIKRHSDPELSYQNGVARLHVPIFTHTDVRFFLDAKIVDMAEGECWYLDLSMPHNVVNGSEINRIHLVIDAVVNSTLKSLITSSVVGAEIL